MRLLRLVGTNWVAHSVERCGRVVPIDHHRGCFLQWMSFDTRSDACSKEMGFRAS